MLESGDRVRVGEHGLEMGEDLRRRPMRVRQLGRRTSCGQCGAKVALAPVEPFPDALPGALASPAVGDDADRRGDADHGALQESPQRMGGHAQPPNFVGKPNAEGPPATAPRMAVAAKDSPSADRLALGTALIETAQKAMANESANSFAMRTRHLLELFRHCKPFVIATAKPTMLTHVRSMLRENR